MGTRVIQAKVRQGEGIPATGCAWTSWRLRLGISGGHWMVQAYGKVSSLSFILRRTAGRVTFHELESSEVAGTWRCRHCLGYLRG